MESVLTKRIKCVHPYKKVVEEDSCFVWCKACKKVIEWLDHSPWAEKRVIPSYWPDDVKALAMKLTGYKAEQDPETRINVPLDLTSQGGNTTSLGDMLKRIYDKNMVIEMQNFMHTNPVFRQLTREEAKKQQFMAAYSGTGRFHFPIKKETK